MAEDNKHENFLNLALDQVVSDRFGRYSKYIIQDRALPDVRDGLKPVQRRILFAMQDLGLLFNKPFKKSAKVVGDVLGKYHPHGDSSIYDAMVRMSQAWKMNMPLIQMHGNNGSVDDDPAAAMRYTEARLAEIAQELVVNLRKQTVPFAPNFDDSEKEPTVLPALLPNLLINGAKGIAAGYATEMPPHNLGEVIDAIIAKIKNPQISLTKIMQYLPGPDFPTGGIIQGEAGIYQAFERGKGRLVIRSKYEVVNLKTKPAILISEIPYGVNKAKLVRDIDELRFNNKIAGIKEVRDETDRKGTAIVIELMPNTQAHLIEKYLLAKTDLQIYYNYNNVAIKNKAPTTLGLMALIDAYLAHQRQVQKRSLNFDLAKFQKRLEVIQGLIKVAQITDQVIETIKRAQGSRQGVIQDLKQKYDFTLIQAEAIAELKLYRLSQTDQTLYLKEATDLEAKIKRLKLILATTQSLDLYLIELLTTLKAKYAIPRRSLIASGEIEQISINAADLIKHENVWIGISRDGYLKRFSNRTYEANNLGSYTLKANDALRYLSLVNTKDKLLIFTNQGNYYALPVHKIAETKFKDVGKHLNDFAAIPVAEKIVAAIAIADFSQPAFIVQATKLGRIKMTPLADFNVTRFSKTYRAFKLTNHDEVVGAKISNGFNDLVLITSNTKATRYNLREITPQGTGASGAKGITLKANLVTNFVVANHDDAIGLVSSRGGMKRVKMSQITPMSRSTQGKSLFREIKGNPHIITSAARVTPQSQALYFTSEVHTERFKAVDFTTIHEGLSLIGPPQTFDAQILVDNRVSADNLFLAKLNADLSEAEKFKQASQAIAAIDQISLEDLLKEL